MKVNYKLAVLASTVAALLLGIIPGINQISSSPKSGQLIAMCKGGGYPILYCEIINGKRVCHRKCPSVMQEVANA